MGESRLLFSLTGQLWPDDGEYNDESWDGSNNEPDSKGKNKYNAMMAHDQDNRGNWSDKLLKEEEKTSAKPVDDGPNPQVVGGQRDTLQQKPSTPTTGEELSQEKPNQKERITLKIRKVKNHSSKRKRKSPGEEIYGWYHISAKSVGRKDKKRKKESEGEASVTNDVTVVKQQQLSLKDFLEPVDGPNGEPFNLPNELIVKIFELVVQNNSKATFNLYNLCKVCETWRQLISTSPSLWKEVDLSGFSEKISDKDLVQFSKFLVHTTSLNFTGWINALSPSNLSRFLDSCGPNLTSIVLRGCYTIDGKIMDLLSVKCPRLDDIDLSRTLPLDPNRVTARNIRKKKTLYPLFPSFQSYLAKNGSKLKSLNFSENKIPSLTHLFTAITSHCHELQSLDLSNIVSSSSFSLKIETLQESCPNLRILRLGNVPILTPKSGNILGFPKLEELSIPCNNSDYGHSESVISSLTKNAENLKLLDIRGSPRVTASCIIKIPAWNLQHLAIDNCSTIFSTGLEMIVGKWKHSLIELDISHNNHQEGISTALEALSSEKNSPLKSITLRGSSVAYESVQKLLINCSNLRLIDLQSCRALPRGTKRVFQDEEVVKFRNDIKSGRYLDYDQ